MKKKREKKRGKAAKCSRRVLPRWIFKQTFFHRAVTHGCVLNHKNSNSCPKFPESSRWIKFGKNLVSIKKKTNIRYYDKIISIVLTFINSYCYTTRCLEAHIWMFVLFSLWARLSIPNLIFSHTARRRRSDTTNLIYALAASMCFLTFKKMYLNATCFVLFGARVLYLFIYILRFAFCRTLVSFIMMMTSRFLATEPHTALCKHETRRTWQKNRRARERPGATMTAQGGAQRRFLTHGRHDEKDSTMRQEGWPSLFLSI